MVVAEHARLIWVTVFKNLTLGLGTVGQCNWCKYILSIYSKGIGAKSVDRQHVSFLKILTDGIVNLSRGVGMGNSKTMPALAKLETSLSGAILPNLIKLGEG